MADKPPNDKRPEKQKKTELDPGRRSFITRMGAGTAGAAVLMNLPPGVPAQEAAQAENGHDPEKGTQILDFTVNGHRHRFRVEPRETLAEILRNRLDLTGTKITCNRGMCGACTVLLGDKAVYSCHTLALDANGQKVTTIEGLMNGEELHPLQQAFVDKDGLQCGFCTPGQIMAAHALLLKNANPSKDDIMTGMSGNLCRCAAYPKIAESVATAAKA